LSRSEEYLSAAISLVCGVVRRFSKMAATLKVKCGSGIYRLSLQEELSYASVIGLLATQLPEQDRVQDWTGWVKYLDDEGDLCTLTEETFEDFRAQNISSADSGTAQVFKLQVQKPKHLHAKPLQELSKDLLGDSTTQDGDTDCHGGKEGGRGTCGGPRKLMLAITALKDADLLDASMFASLAVQWLPIIAQRIARKVDKINYMAKCGLSSPWQQFLESIRLQVAATPGLEQFDGQLAAALAGTAPSNCQLGETLVELLKALRSLDFSVKVSIARQLSAHAVPILDDFRLGAEGAGPCSWSHGSSALQHPRSACDGCNVIPIIGPRFRCQVCDDYDLCGACFARKHEIHTENGSDSHEFQCILPGHFKGSGKGTTEDASKGRGWKGMGTKGAFKGRHFTWNRSFSGMVGMRPSQLASMWHP